MDYREQYDAWCASPAVDAAAKAELMAIADDPHEIEERFYRELEFGTAGLRGILGAGTNRMNPYVVRRATQGLSDYLLSIPGAKERGVCIAYDSRRGSTEFAKETAATLAANGIRVYLFSTLHAVPQLSFALQRLHCISGVVITASHNPKQYNGYKVYWEYGGQCAPEQAAEIYACIGRVPMFGAKTADFDAAVADGRITMIGDAEDEAYYAATQGLLLCPDMVREDGHKLKLVYTPLHGTGNVPVTTLLSRIGVTNVSVVPEQALPDGDFPTVKAPNPVVPNAFALSIALAERTGATVCLATDPDADRLGVAVKTNAGEWVTLTGNQIGALLLEHILSERKAAGTLPDNGVVIKSIVSTKLADAIAGAYGAEMVVVPTGFRFIGEKIDEYARTGEKTFLFGFEESFGFLAGGLARDKDAICAAMLLSELAVKNQCRGRTLSDALDALYETYGYYLERVNSYTLAGKAGMERIAACMAALREAPPQAFAGVAAESFEDYQAGRVFHANGTADELTLPQTDMLRWLLDGGAWLVIRPSGTEPKLKLYIGANASTRAASEDALAALFAFTDGLLRSLLGL